MGVRVLLGVPILPAVTARGAVPRALDAGRVTPGAGEAGPAPPEWGRRADQAMELALAEAERAAGMGEVPVGAVIIGPDGRLLARAHNETELRKDPTAHAERLAIERACRHSGWTRLPEGSLLAVTLEPCAMCAGAIVLARPSALVFGALDPKAGACGSLRNVVEDPRLNHRVVLLPARQAEACGAMLTSFFRARRGRVEDGGGSL